MVLVLSAFACKESSQNSISNDVFYLDTPGGSNIPGCYSKKITYVYVSVRGYNFWVEAPTECNDEPQIYKADSGRDMGELYTFKEVSKKDIIQAFQIKFDLIKKSDKKE